MKSIAILLVLFTCTAVVPRICSAQVRVSESVTISQECLAKAGVITDAVDWDFLGKVKEPSFLPYHKKDYLDHDWMMNFIQIGESQILVGWPTKKDDTPFTKVFGIFESVNVQKPESRDGRVTLRYRSVLPECSAERQAIIGLLAEDGRYGKRQRQYAW